MRLTTRTIDAAMCALHQCNLDLMEEIPKTRYDNVQGLNKEDFRIIKAIENVEN